MKETYCEWCGSVLLEDGRCPVADCVQNVILDALDDVDTDPNKEEGKPNGNSNA